MDDFNNNASTGWSKTAGFVASNTMMVDSNTDATVDTILKDDFTDDDHEIRFSYRRTSNNSGDRVSVYARFVDWDNYIRVEFFANNTCRVLEKANGSATIIATGSAASTTNTWYDVRIVCDDTSVKAYHKTGTNLESQVLSATSAVTTSSKIGIVTWSNTTADLDNIWLIGDSLSNTTTFAVNNANELTTMTDPNGTTTFAFDAWGRMTSKTRGSYEAEYGYKSIFLLNEAVSTFPGEGEFSTEYRGDGKRHSYTEEGIVSKLRWRRGHSLSAVEDGYGNLQSTVVGNTAAVISGSDASQGSYEYFDHDAVKTPRAIRNQSASLQSRFETGPFGDAMYAQGVEFPQKFTGHAFASSGAFYLTAYRIYMPSINRWLTKDPLSQFPWTNGYVYANLNPSTYFDELGLYSTSTSTQDEAGHVTVTITVPILFRCEGATAANIKRLVSAIESTWRGQANDNTTVYVHVDVFNDIRGICPPRGTNVVCLKNALGRSDAKTWYLGDTDNLNAMAAHEAGHLMGLYDMYDYDTDLPIPGYEGNLMGDLLGSVWTCDLEQIMGGYNEPYAPKR